METKILELLGRRDYVPLAIQEIEKRCGFSPSKRRELQKILVELERSGQIARLKGNRYGFPLEADLIPGRIRMNRQGKGFLNPDDPKLPEVMIPAESTGTALHGDRVLVRRDVRPVLQDNGRKPGLRGSVIRVLERARVQLVGTLQRSKQFLYVIPDEPRIPHDIYVPLPRDVGRQANVGDKVVVELRDWPSRHVNPEGEIVEVLGPPTAEGVDMLSVLRNYNLPLRFPKKTLNETRAFGTEVQEEDLRGRVDCRQHLVVTIDPDDAKDFDDAICLQAQPNREWKLWVHIADVSHYVKPGTALDEEARKRGNSTYLVDRVIPMLPEALSNELCSLKPHVDRLTQCAEFLLSADGRVLRAQFYSAVIRSQRRFSYREAFAILQRPPTDPIEQMLHQANELTQKIRRTRFKAGSLDLDFPETKIRLDEQGRVARIEKVENDVSHQLIEECMLLANEAVAARLTKRQRPTIYRVHEPPSPERLREYREELLLHQVRCGDLTNRREVQRLLEKLNHLPFGQPLKIGFLKSLMRARYGIEPLGHYGLAKQNYAHFTSPIRRYADLVVHRSLLIDGERPNAAPDKDGASGQSGNRPSRNAAHRRGDIHSPRQLKEIADHISETERNSDDAERDSRDVKLFAFLREQLESNRLESYRALVIDVRNFGFFVEVSALGLSGLVHLSSMTDDFYIHDPSRAQLIGRRSRRIIKLADQLEVQVAKLDSFKKQVDFKLVNLAADGAKPKKLQRRPSHR
jgi:ribonuclease R